MSNSVIELAQLLTQALDENFNIKNQSAVVKVVTCLEAFNITHESYREVQNTRIIKDLQALRQNKANDQVLAKRIKNLLRKWKERLASSAPSQPNSPQNISQGSSDTQFMTQQSQSPPNSQPPRIVNGPTSFKNLLPKSQNHHQAVTSPVPHIYQNGGVESSSTTLLGKRKLPPSSVDGNSGDIDENSNHSRKKMMKKSNSGAISSPLTFNNSSINHNNQQINKLHPTVPPVPQQLSHHPPPPQQKPDEPKKRGRRKGSKGIDSTLNGSFFPDFQAEIQQKIALSAGKRNKTTFELQQMLESHQNTSTSWTNGDVLDSSSLDRVNNISSSSYHPNESSFNNFDEPKIKTELKKELTDDYSPSIQSKPQSQPQPEFASSSLKPLTIEDEIAQLQARLPPIDYEAAARAIFNDLDTYDDRGDLIRCTCTFREVITYADEEEEKPAAQSKSNGFEETKVNGDNSKKPNDSEHIVNDDDDDDDDDDETDDFCAVEDIEREKSPPLRSAVKSIFDPEYDANENLIEEMMMVRRKPRDNLPKVIEVKIEKDTVKSSRIESMMMAETIPQQMERVPIITYVCDEDPLCPARAHFRRDPVTKEDVKRLHKSFLPGINGYLNGVPEEKEEHDYSKDNGNIDYAKYRLWKRVVPRYDFLTLDKVPKTFDDDSPFSLPPLPPLQLLANVKTETNDDTERKKIDSFNDTMDNEDGNNFSLLKYRDIEFREWHEVMRVQSYNDEVLTILPYVVID